MDHPTPQQLADLSLGRLPPEEVDTVAAHLDECTTCRSAVVKHDDTVEDSLVAAARAPQADPFAEPQRDEALAAAERLVGDSADSAEADEWKTEFLASADASESSDVQGKVIGEYVILNKIGAGGMGEVYKARHRRMKRIVALKLLPNAAMATPEAVKRFRREVEAAARLMHPNIVVAHDAGEADGVHFLVMEYVEGEDLAAIVKQRGPLPIEQAVSYCLQAAAGLSYAHSQGIVHRDIKPSNLLLDKNGTLKILDMGLARVDVEAVFAADADGPREELTNSGQVMGTADYMAPEQSLDTRNADAKADVYSLGCTLFRMVTGRTPYVADSVLKRFLAHREEPIPSATALRPDVPRRLDDLLRRMLAKRASARPSMDDVIAELSAMKAQASGGGRKRPPSRIAVAAAGAAAFFALLGVWVIVRDKHGEEVGRMKVPEQGSVVVQDGATTKPTDPAEEAFEARATAVGLDRAIAEWAQSLGAMIKIKFTNGTNRYSPSARLPSFAFKLVGIEFTRDRPPATAQLERLARLSDLEELSLYSSPTTDDGLRAICQIAGLRKLFMAMVGFSPSGWSHLPKLKKLESLSLNYVQLGDLEMKAISQTTSLQFLDLYDCQIKGAGVEHLAGMPNLRHFTTEEGINDASLAKLLKTTKLDLLGLLYTREVSAAGLLPIRDAATIKNLLIWGPSFSSSHFKSLGQLEQIETLDLWMVPFNDEDLQGLVGMKALHTLKLRQGTRITSAGVAAFRKARPKVSVEWTPPGSSVPAAPAVKPTNVAGGGSIAGISADRAAAELVQRLGGDLTLRLGDVERNYSPKATLPSQDFRVTAVEFHRASELTDADLVTFLALDALTCLRISSPRVTDAGIVTISKMVSLKKLYLGGFEFVSKGVPHLANLPDLNVLSFAYGKLDEPSVAALGKIKTLTELDLYATKLPPTSARHLVALPQLATLALTEGLDDTCIALLCDSSKLRWLGVPQDVSPIGLTKLAGSKSLHGLSLWGPRISDGHLAALEELKQVDTVWLWKAAITDDGLRSLGKCRHLKHITIRDCTKTTSMGVQRLQKALPGAYVGSSLPPFPAELGDRRK